MARWSSVYAEIKTAYQQFHRASASSNCEILIPNMNSLALVMDLYRTRPCCKELHMQVSVWLQNDIDTHCEVTAEDCDDQVVKKDDPIGNIKWQWHMLSGTR